VCRESLHKKAAGIGCGIDAAFDNGRSLCTDEPFFIFSFLYVIDDNDHGTHTQIAWVRASLAIYTLNRYLLVCCLVHEWD
jgi:hypothetical protein